MGMEPMDSFVPIIEHQNCNMVTIGKVPEEPFIIVSGTHMGALFDMINLRLILNRENKAVLFVTDSFIKKHIVDLVKRKVFDAAIYYDGTVGFEKSKFKDTVQIKNYFDDVMDYADIHFSKVLKAYLYSDVHDQIGVYLQVNGIKTIAVEFVKGQFDMLWRYEAFYKEGKITKDLYDLQKDNRIFSGEQSFGRIRWNEERKYDETAFDSIHASEYLSDLDRSKMLQIFEDYDYDNKDVILLNSTNYLRNNGLKEKDCKLFGKIMNMYFSDKEHTCVIKLHPYCYKTDYFLTDSVEVVSGQTNIDIIKYSNKRINQLITFGSSGYDKLKDFCKKTVNVGAKMYSQYMLYPIIDYLSELCFRNGFNLKQKIIDDESFQYSNLSMDKRFRTQYRSNVVVSSGSVESIEVYDSLISTNAEADVKKKMHGCFSLVIEGDGISSFENKFYFYTDDKDFVKIFGSASERRIDDMVVRLKSVEWDSANNSFEAKNKEIRLGKICKKKMGNRTRLICHVEFVADNSTVFDSIYFEVDSKYGKYLDDKVSDAFVFASILYGATFGYNVRTETPMSDNFNFMMSEFFIPAITNQNVINQHLYCVQLFGNTIKHKTSGKYIGTGITRGVDSMYSSMRGSKSSDRLTHNVLVHWGGSFTEFTSVEIQNICDYIGTEPVDIATNLTFVFKDLNKTQMPFDQFIVSAVIATRPMWKRYLFSSGYQVLQHLDRGSPGNFDHFIEIPMYCVSGDGFHAIFDGGGVGRLQKTEALKDFEPAQKYLNDCFKSSVKNCGWCSKCIRTMIGLDLSDSLDRFCSVFDTDEYRVEYRKYIHFMVLSRNDTFMDELYQKVKMKYPNEIADIEKIQFDIKNNDSNGLLAKLTLYYADQPGYYYSRYRKALYYKEGVTLDKDYNQYANLLDQICEEHDNLSEVILKEYSSSLYSSHQWAKLKDIYDKYPESPSICLAIARMYRDGKGCEVDTTRAIEMMKKMADKGNAVASNEYVDIVLQKRLVEMYDDAYARTVYLAEHKDSGAQYRMANMYAEGKCVKKNYNKAIMWMEMSRDNGFPLAEKGLIQLKQNKK